MSSFDGPLVAFSTVVEENRARHIARRVAARKRYDDAVERHTVKYRDDSGYKLGPMMDEYLIRRYFRPVMCAMIERQLLTLTTPLFKTVQAMDRALHHVTIFASPSGNGAERYAPKPRGTMPQQIRVGVESAHEGHYAN